MSDCNQECCDCNQNNGPSPKEIAFFISEIANVAIKLKENGILSQSTIDHANEVAITALNKVEEIISNVDAVKAAGNNDQNSTPVAPTPVEVPAPYVMPDPQPVDPMDPTTDGTETK
jgi:hypothetical protein